MITCGFGAEAAAWIADELFTDLDASLIGCNQTSDAFQESGLTGARRSKDDCDSGWGAEFDIQQEILCPGCQALTKTSRQSRAIIGEDLRLSAIFYFHGHIAQIRRLIP